MTRHASNSDSCSASELLSTIRWVADTEPGMALARLLDLAGLECDGPIHPGLSVQDALGQLGHQLLWGHRQHVGICLCTKWSLGLEDLNARRTTNRVDFSDAEDEVRSRHQAHLAACDAIRSTIRNQQGDSYHGEEVRS